MLTWGTDVYPELSGYKVYYQQDSSTIPFTGTGATQGNSPVDVHNQTSATISGLDPSHGYYFAITAYSTAGLESPYSNLVYIPELIPPVVSLSSPANNATVTGTVSVAATASDNVGVSRVEFYVNNVLQSADTSTPYLYSWDTTPLAAGSYTLMAKAYDAAGNVGQSTSVMVTVFKDTTPPTISVTAPGNNAKVSGTVPITASASDDVGVTRVEIYQNTLLLYAGNLAPYSYNWNTAAIGNGSYALTAKAYDAAGNVGLSPTVNVSVNNSLVCSSPPVLIAGISYPDFQSSYEQAPGNAVIELQAMDLSSNMLLDRNIQVRVQGGYDCGFTSSSTATGMLGNLNVTNGTAIIDMLYFK